MEAKYINAFVQAFREVIGDLSGIYFNKEDLQLKKYPKPLFNIAILLGVSGYISGQVVSEWGNVKQAIADAFSA